MQIRYHLDEHVHPGIAGVFERSIAVTTTSEVGLIGVADEKHLYLPIASKGCW